VGTKIYIWLSMAFIVCYKIKHGGFDFHIHSTSLYHLTLSISKKKEVPTYPTHFYTPEVKLRTYYGMAFVRLSVRLSGHTDGHLLGTKIPNKCPSVRTFHPSVRLSVRPLATSCPLNILKSL